MDKVEFVNEEDYATRMVGFQVDCNEGKGDMLACQRVGEFLSVVKEDYKKAADTFSKNCDGRGFAPSCFSLARLLGMLMVVVVFRSNSSFVVAGKGIEQSDSKGLKYFGKFVLVCYQYSLTFLQRKLVKVAINLLASF